MSENSKLQVTIIIPTKNEAETLGEIIDQCQPFCDELIVIDGHSTDDTRKVATERGVRLLLDGGAGKGQALRMAAQEATHELIVFVDADGSHIPTDIPKIIAPILAGEADHVTASRLIGGSSELHGGFDEFFRLAGSSFITACINWRFKVCISDSQNGFRAIKRSVFLRLGLKSNSTTIEQEMVMRTLKQGYKLAEVPSHERCRMAGESKIVVTRDWYKYLASLIQGLFF